MGTQTSHSGACPSGCEPGAIRGSSPAALLYRPIFCCRQAASTALHPARAPAILAYQHARWHRLQFISTDSAIYAASKSIRAYASACFAECVCFFFFGDILASRIYLYFSLSSLNEMIVNSISCKLLQKVKIIRYYP